MDLTPHGWHLWLLAGIAVSALELHFGNFVLIWFGVGALASAAGAALGLPLDAQLLTFLLTSCALFGASRTLFKRLFARGPDRIHHGEAAMIGAEATVVQALNETFGSVRLHGELWSARSLEGAVAAGEAVRVERVDGLTLYVRRAQAAVWTPLATKDENP